MRRFCVSINIQKDILYIVLIKNAIVPSPHSNQPRRTKVHGISLSFDVISASDSL